MEFKRAFFSIVRETHRVLARRSLPDHLALYFHDLPEAHWPLFREAMLHFKDRGYRIVGAAEFAAGEPGEKLLWVSFDDNHAVWHRALGLFDELGVRATFFINTGPLGSEVCPDALSAYFDRIDHHGERRPLTRNETLDIVKAGHDLGCHTAWHFPLTSLCVSRWRTEIAESKAMLEDIAAKPIEDLAFPYGMRRFFNERLAEYCHGLGVTRIASGIPGFQHAWRANPSMIHRTRWLFEHDLTRNVDDICIDGRLFERLTGRSAIG